MAEFEQTQSIDAAPDEAFRFLGEPTNMPLYIATMVRAQPAGQERLEVAAEVEGRHEEGEARFHADQALRRVEWSGASNRSYHGWLQVNASNAEGSAVTIHLITDDDANAGDVERAIDQTLSNIAAHFSKRD